MYLVKKILPDAVVVALFALISVVYFYPANVEGLVLGQHDHAAGVGANQESQEYLERTGERTRWTNALFGGMPTYQMAPAYDSTKLLGKAEALYHLYIPGYTYYVFILLLGFYILLRAFDFRSWMAALGAVIWAFSSYFFIIIAAGHIWKVWTLAYIPATIAGMVLIYRNHWLGGALVTAFFTALQIRSNHVQMSYYFLMPMLFMAIAYGMEAWRSKQMAGFLKSTAVLIVAGVVGVCTNLSNLYHTYEYSKETMRGKSELVKPNSSNQTSSGLERDYITAWSYGIGETWTLLVPNTKGGASVPLGLNEEAMKKATPMYRGIYNQIGQYWGEQPGTSGPVYVGAFVVTLFLLGLLIVRGPMKWALLVATLLSILLSWGKNFMGFTDFFIDYVPMYAKFRTVASILVVAEFTIPLLAMLALKEVEKCVSFKQLKTPLYVGGRLSLQNAIYISVGVTAGFSLLFALLPGTFFPNYISTNEMAMLKNGLPTEHLNAFVANLTEVRQSIFVADAWRSFFIVVVGTVVVMLFANHKLGAKWMVGLLLVLCLFDMWQVNRRYLNPNDKHQFTPKREVTDKFQKTTTDKVILKDTALDYRVLNLASNTFNENNTSYFHKSVGGYHAAKLRRYQEMIGEHISAEMRVVMDEALRTDGNMDSVRAGKFPVLNMLNTRWFIMPAQGGQTMPLFNPHALGNAWFVKNVRYVADANEEIASLHEIDPAVTAVVDSRFKEQVKEQPSAGKIVLKSYDANRLAYETDSETGGVVVFSEIYYPGWRSSIDGQEVEHGRADYILRAMNVPAGKHTVEFVFDPISLHVTETIAYIAIGLLLVGALVWVVRGILSCFASKALPSLLANAFSALMKK